MKKRTQIKVPIMAVMKKMEVTVKVTGMSQFRLRMFCSKCLVRLALLVAGCRNKNINIDTSGAT